MGTAELAAAAVGGVVESGVTPISAATAFALPNYLSRNPI